MYKLLEIPEDERDIEEEDDPPSELTTPNPQVHWEHIDLLGDFRVIWLPGMRKRGQL